MKTLTVRVPEPVVARLDAESRRRGLSRSDVVRERLDRDGMTEPAETTFDAISDLVGSVDGTPADLSARKKAYLKKTKYGGPRSR